MVRDTKLRFPAEADELKALLKEDQAEWRDFAKEEFEADNGSRLEEKRVTLRQRVTQRANRVQEILNDIKEPSISNVGIEGAIAISVLATHTSLEATRQALAAFTVLYRRKPGEAHYQSIPSMTDWILILERKPQKFGTIWLFDINKEPFLPTVEDFEHLNERRAEYGLQPLRWPKSLAVPTSKQPWLKKPLSKLVMREPTDEEYGRFASQFLD
jgi:hypothetical protein